jgi:pimeloyl-ACP methyl ester carboxylesterase
LCDVREDRGEIIVDGKRLETFAYRTACMSHPWIVMLHEGLGSVSMWRDFPAQLASSTGCSVLAYSRYGHGKSEVLCEPRTLKFMHHEAGVVLPTLLESLGIQQPILFGHSDGGSICLIHAASFPAMTRGMILEAPHVFVEELTLQSIAKIREEFLGTNLRAKLARHHDHPDEMFYRWTDIWLDPGFRSWNIEDCLESVRCPVLVIQGEDDEYGTLAQVEAIRRRIRGAEALTLVNCGHAPHRDQLQATLTAVMHFVRKVL